MKTDMKICTADKKAEAVRRMKMMGIYGPTINQFRRSQQVSVSEGPLGGFYWMDEKDRKAVRKFEQEHNALVYMGVRSRIAGDEVDSYFYVSDTREEWADDREALQNGETVAYCYNRTAPGMSEAGWIGFRPTCGAGVRRVW